MDLARRIIEVLRIKELNNREKNKNNKLMPTCVVYIPNRMTGQAFIQTVLPSFSPGASILYNVWRLCFAASSTSMYPALVQAVRHTNNT